MLEDVIVSKKINIVSYNTDDHTVLFSDDSSKKGSFIVTDDKILDYNIIGIKKEEFLSDINSFSFLNSYKHSKDIFIVGCGSDFIIPHNYIKNYIESLGFGLEWTKTQFAYSVFNAIVQEYRTCIALFINET